MKILVVGGSGYIGSITVKYLIKNNHEVVVFDSLEKGHEKAVTCELIVGNLLDKKSFSLIQGTFDAVIHFAAYASVEESMKKPFDYFNNNVFGGFNLLEFMKDRNIPYIIFSSSCSIYGMSKQEKVKEADFKDPLSVYGETKLLFERILDWFYKIYNIRYINLRYFNAAGAALDGSLGENHNPETHIIPLAIQTALGKQKEFLLFGNDYNTPDGTCIRDYIHVEDLAKAHMMGIDYLKNTLQCGSFNLGSGRGYSNAEVIEMVKRISGNTFPIRVVKRRLGDPAVVYADITKAKKYLGFTPEYSDLETIIKTAWNWHKK